ncbi:MAG: CpsD/CapB family tyrosine-protein kinase [Romboutsia sp.]
MFIYDKLPKSISAEAYNSIRTSIKYSSIDKPIKTIVVTSSVPGEGKSTVAGNIAISLSKNGSRVLIIDCDLRRPTLHRKFKISNQKGLTDYLIDKCDIEKVTQSYSSKLFIITAGSIPTNPSEIIGSKTMELFIEDIYINYDYIILDTPPLLAVTDAQLLAGKNDATLLVVRYGKTKEKLIMKAYKELTKVKANVIGSILNGYETKGIGEYYNYYDKGDNKKIIKEIKIRI